ncbi:hypothetical protein HD806DRAFT_22303 [Xylariaceae sp. AK1471]|nr:hypothetical protein HD806DRAFT_22303 [Xylariaceae sp. AK1471]
MRFPLVLVMLSLIILAEAQNFSSYVPECVPPCVEQTLNSSKICTGLNDNKCLCTNFGQVLFPSTICFMQTCNSTNGPELRTQVISGWQKFCSDSGTPVDLSMSWGPGGPGGSWGPGSPVSNSSATSSVTPSIPPTSSPPSASTSASILPSTPIPAPTSGLSTGAKAGIGVGAGLGALTVIGGLLFLGFRLGQRRKEASRSNLESARHVDEGGDPKYDGLGNQGSTTMTTTEIGQESWGYKPQLDGTALAELPSRLSPDMEMHGHDINELPVHERPTELWHGDVTPELSADAEVPRDRIQGNARL